MAVDFWYDLVSPTAYLAWTQRARLEAAGEVRMRPMLLGFVFKANGNLNPKGSPARWAWLVKDMERRAARYDVPFRIPRNFPLNTIAPMRAAAALEGDERYPVFLEAAFGAIFGRGEDISDPEILRAALKAAGLEAKPILASMTEQSVKDKLKANTDWLLARGVFGAPTFFVGDEMFFGEDRIAETLAAATG